MSERMETNLKVYGWNGFPRGADSRQTRLIVAAKSFAQAQRDAEAAGAGKPSRNYCSESGNEVELAVALAQPGTVFAALSNYGPGHKTFFPVVDGELRRSATEGPQDG